MGRTHGPLGLQRLPVFTALFPTKEDRLGRVIYNPVIFGKSQPAKNRNLHRLILNLSRLNCSSERNSVYCFSTAFTL
jgi:hypothetical protein